MRKIRLPQIAENHPVAFWFAILFHAALLAGLTATQIQKWELPAAKNVEPVAIQKSLTVDLKAIEDERQRLIDAEARKKKAAEDARKNLENLQTLEQNLKSQIADAEQKREAAVAAKNLLEQQKILAEQKQKAALDAKNKAEEQKVEAEKKRQAAVAAKEEIERQKNLAEQALLAAEVEKQAAIDAKIKAQEQAEIAAQEAQKLTQAHQQAAAAFDRAQKKHAVTLDIQDEEIVENEIEIENQLLQLQENYISRIQEKVRSRWLYTGFEDNWRCQVKILQNAKGEVESAQVQSCQNVDPAALENFKLSVERAVQKASPLPAAPDEQVFDREILFDFRVN